jgi:hypothetical protein
MKIIKTVILLCFFYASVNAQPYVFINTKTEGLIQSNTSWVDVNKDGYQDLVTTGERFSANQKIVETNLYINNKKGGFNLQNSGIANMYRSAMDWEDLDKDGDKDLLITGENSQGQIIARIYKNNGWGRFSGYDPHIQAVRDGAIDIGDFNGDGKHDIVVCGEFNGQIYSKVYKNINNSSFSEMGSNLVPLYGGSVSWGDYDGDKDGDILISGETNEGYAYSIIYQNVNNNEFIGLNAPLRGVKSGKAVWGDFDGDRDLDVFITGEDNFSQMISYFYRNDGRKGFTELGTSIMGMRSGEVDVKDYDCDGDLDLLVSGESIYGPTTRVYRNEGDFVFMDANAGLPGVYLGGAYWADYDKDCDAEIFIMGLDDCYDFEAKLYRNDADIEIQPAKKAETSSLWISSSVSYIKKSPYYYFVWSSCYCNPPNRQIRLPGSVSNNEYNMFISDIHYITEPYKLQRYFNNKITYMVHDWAEVMGGHRVSIGYLTKQKAEAAKAQIIRDYQSEKFSVNSVTW